MESASKGVSEWNASGSWEERNKTQWANETLTSLFDEATFLLTVEDRTWEGSCSLTKCKDIDARIVFVRGEPRFTYDMDALELSLHFQCNEREEERSGKLIVRDLCHDHDQDLDNIEWQWVGRNSLSVTEKRVWQRALQRELSGQVLDVIGRFEEDFRRKMEG